MTRKWLILYVNGKFQVFRLRFATNIKFEGCLQDIACLYLLIFLAFPSLSLSLLNSTEAHKNFFVLEQERKKKRLRVSSVHASSREASVLQCTTHGTDYKANFPNRLRSNQEREKEKKKLNYKIICLFGYMYIEQYSLY